MSTTAQTVADVHVEPRKERRFPRGWDGKEHRHIESEWLVRTDDEGRAITLVLSCGHTRGSYYALVNNERHEGNGVVGSMPFNSERILREPCARYNRGQFESFAQRAITQLRAMARAGQLDAYLRGDQAPTGR